MVELEQLTENRFYKLIPQWQAKCTCGGMLWLNMKAGSVNQKCRHVGCYKEFDIPRFCNTCSAQYEFDDAICNNCESDVVEITACKLAIVEISKSIKNTNREHRLGDISDEEHDTVFKQLTDEVKRCESRIEEISNKYTN